MHDAKRDSHTDVGYELTLTKRGNQPEDEGHTACSIKKLAQRAPQLLPTALTHQNRRQRL